MQFEAGHDNATLRQLSYLRHRARVHGCCDPQRPGWPAAGSRRTRSRRSAYQHCRGRSNVRRGDSGDWVAAVINAPLMVDDRVATGAGARAEVQFDSANLVRIGANAEIRLAELALNHYHLQIAHGTVTFRVLRDFRPGWKWTRRTFPSALPSRRLSHLCSRPTVRPKSPCGWEPRRSPHPSGTEQLQAGQTMLARGDCRRSGISHRACDRHG